MWNICRDEYPCVNNYSDTICWCNLQIDAEHIFFQPSWWWIQFNPKTEKQRPREKLRLAHRHTTIHERNSSHARNFGGARSFLRFRKWFQLFAPVYLVPLACGRSFKTCKKTFPPNLTNAQLIPCMLCALPFRQGNSSLFSRIVPLFIFSVQPHVPSPSQP